MDIQELPEFCECNKYDHKDKACVRAPNKQYNLRSSPALCIPCLFMCFADEDDNDLASS